MALVDKDDVTLGELGRRVDRLESQMWAGFEGIRAELRGLAFVPAGVYASDQAACNMRINRLEENYKTNDARSWQVKLAVIAALFSAMLTLGITVVLAYIGFS